MLFRVRWLPVALLTLLSCTGADQSEDEDEHRANELARIDGVPPARQPEAPPPEPLPEFHHPGAPPLAPASPRPPPPLTPQERSVPGGCVWEKLPMGPTDTWEGKTPPELLAQFDGSWGGPLSFQAGGGTLEANVIISAEDWWVEHRTNHNRRGEKLACAPDAGFTAQVWVGGKRFTGHATLHFSGKTTLLVDVPAGALAPDHLELSLAGHWGDPPRGTVNRWTHSKVPVRQPMGPILARR